jgi:hypothetical protein
MMFLQLSHFRCQYHRQMALTVNENLEQGVIVVVNGTGDKLIASVNDTDYSILPLSFTPVSSLSPVSFTPVADNSMYKN